MDEIKDDNAINSKASWKKIFNIFCCPPTISSISAKLAFIQMPSTYSVDKIILPTTNGSKATITSLNTLENAEIAQVSNSDSNNLIENYNLSKNSSSQEIIYEYSMGFRFDKYIPNDFPNISRYLKIFFIKPKNDPTKKICALHICPFETPNFTILYSHGNAVDLGQLAAHLFELGKCLKCNVISYDYAGYGLSPGRANEKNVCSYIDSLYNHMINNMKIDPKKLVLYGQSIGSVPTIYLASSITCAGVIVHSGLASGIRVIFPYISYNSFIDVFKNSTRIKGVQSPTLIIHGMNDEIVHFQNGQLLYDNCKNPVQPLWISEAGHNDIELYDEYIMRLMKFFNVDLKSSITPV